MTIVGGGGVHLKRLILSEDFHEDYAYLDATIQKRADNALKKLLMYPIPPGLEFEKLKGRHDPDIYTIHVTGNIKVSMTIVGDTARLRHIDTHRRIDRNP